MNHCSHLKVVAAVVVGFIVFAALGAPVLTSLPLLAFLVVCPLMMIFMMRGMGHGGGKNGENVDATPSSHKH